VVASKGNLGAVTELTFYDIEAAVKVTEVTPGSPAARAGLQPGLVILRANDKAILHPNDLNDAARKSGGTLKLTVVDPRSGRKGTVDVQLD
jgi:serine protease Do